MDFADEPALLLLDLGKELSLEILDEDLVGLDGLLHFLGLVLLLFLVVHKQGFHLFQLGGALDGSQLLVQLKEVQIEAVDHLFL